MHLFVVYSMVPGQLASRLLWILAKLVLLVLTDEDPIKPLPLPLLLTFRVLDLICRPKFKQDQL